MCTGFNPFGKQVGREERHGMRENRACLVLEPAPHDPDKACMGCWETAWCPYTFRE